MRRNKCVVILLVFSTGLFSAESIKKAATTISITTKLSTTRKFSITTLSQLRKSSALISRNMGSLPDLEKTRRNQNLQWLDLRTDSRLLSGGPDGYGYTYESNQDGDPVTFYWIEIRDTTNDLHLADDDVVYVPLSFSFPFYDSTYDTLTIASNGLIYFEDYYIGTGNTALPSNAYGGGDIIAVFWDDLRPLPYGTGTVYFKDFQTFAVIEWDSVPIYGQTTYNTFEVIIYDDGLIKMQYLFMNYTQSDATIGIQDSTAYSTGNGWYLQYFYNGNPYGHTPTANTVIVFYPPTQDQHDVGVESIDEPTPYDTLAMGDTLWPRATIRNDGSSYDTCYVHFGIWDSLGGQVYSDWDTLALGAGASAPVYFTYWLPPDVGTYTDSVWVMLPGDMNPGNDKMGSEFYVRYGHDVGVESIDEPAPYDTLEMGDPLLPRAIIRNDGLSYDTCYVHFGIWDSLGGQVYSDWDTLALGAGASAPVYFTYWLPPDVGTYTDSVWVMLPGDMNPGNDKMGSEFYVRYGHDVGVESIDAPYDTVAFGESVTPQVTVRNNGLNHESFSVIYHIYDARGTQVYSSTHQVDSLDVGTSTSLTFSPWTPELGGTFTNQVMIDLPEDQNPSNDTATSQTFVQMPGTDYLIIDIDPTRLSGPLINNIMQNLGYGGVYSTDISDLSDSTMTPFSAVWLMLGMYPNNYQLDSSQTLAIRTYLMNGGSMYLEGGDCWGQDLSRWILDSIFGIDPANTQDGFDDLTYFMGLSGGVSGLTEADTFAYYGENSRVDRLSILPDPPFGGQITPILYNYMENYYTGVSYENSIYTTIASSHEIGGVSPVGLAKVGKRSGNSGSQVLSDPPVDSLVLWFMEFLAYPPPYGVEENTSVPKLFFLNQNTPNPFRSQTVISFGLPKAARVSLVIYDAVGRKVRTLIRRDLDAGYYNIPWNGTDDSGASLASGTYILRLMVENQSPIYKKIILLR